MISCDLSHGESLRNAGMAAARANDNDFTRRAISYMRAWLWIRKHNGAPNFVFEEFRASCENAGIVPRSSNGWGALARTAADRGLIADSGLPYVKAKSARTHAHKIPVWRAL